MYILHFTLLKLRTVYKDYVYEITLFFVIKKMHFIILILKLNDEKIVLHIL